MKLSTLIAAAACLMLVSPAHAESSTDTARAGAEPQLDTEKHFWRAAGETVIIGWSPWLFSHFVKDYPYADISMDSVRRNLKNPPWWDADNFHTNMWGHPFQGSLYYNAARENGFGFWEAIPFVAAGNLGWEYLMETEPPAYNDMSNTFFGGMARGEMTYRLSLAVRDNRAHGWKKFWTEVGAGFINPVGFADRLVFGDMFKDMPNPPDRYPSKLFLMLDGGYQHRRAENERQDQGIGTLTMRYNDPHTMRIHKPFDYFDLESSMVTSKGPLFPLVSYRGLLAGWDLMEDAETHHMVSPGLTFEYFNNGPSSFGGSNLDITLLSRWKMPHEFDVRTEVSGQAYIAAGIQTDYKQNNIDSTGRNYDFGSGGGPKIDLRIRRDAVDWFRGTVSAGWFPTHNGLSTINRIFLATTEVRYPLTRELFAGMSWSYTERYTQYADLPTVTMADSALRFFLSWAFRVF